MKSVIRFLVLASLLAVVACERTTLNYAGTAKDKPGQSSPDYTVQPKLNPPTK